MNGWSVFWMKERESEGQPMVLVEMVRGLGDRAMAIKWLQENGSEGEVYYVLQFKAAALVMGPRGGVTLAGASATGRV